jgi:predicted acetyltransferase
MIETAKARPEDSTILGQMNKHLIEDEGHRNPMSVEELKVRMENWLRSDWEAVFINKENARIGYALYQWRTEPFDLRERSVYLRQFFVSRSHRRKGVGTQAFNAIKDAFWADAKRIEVEVLTKNKEATAFWHSLGFVDYSLSLKLTLE